MCSRPDGVVGEQVEVSGVLRRTERFAARVADDGAFSLGYHLLTVD